MSPVLSRGLLRAGPSAPPCVRLCYEAFAVLHSGETKTPVYVAQPGLKSIEDADERRADKFFADARLPVAERAELEDYKRSGFSRGHMAPAGDMPTPTAMAQSFSLANMVPQNAQQNGGSWAKIEQDTQDVLRAKGDVYVITGPGIELNPPTIGEGRVRVPRYLFKLVYATTGPAAHWQENRERGVVSAPITYTELIRRTGVEFLLGLREVATLPAQTRTLIYRRWILRQVTTGKVPVKTTMVAA